MRTYISIYEPPSFCFFFLRVWLERSVSVGEMRGMHINSMDFAHTTRSIAEVRVYYIIILRHYCDQLILIWLIIKKKQTENFS